jgi:hypothetical protein
VTLINRDTPKNDPKKEKARNVNSKRKYYSNIIILSQPSEVLVLEYGDKIFNQLIAGQMDDLSEWKNFMHPAQGRNLYITKVKMGPEKKEVDYKVEPRMATSALPDPTVLTRLYDVNNIVALIEAGTVKPTTQSKFDFQKTEVRFLPSGDRTKPLLFFKQVYWHFNVSKEQFDAIQAGKYNPVTDVYTASAPPTTSSGTSTYKPPVDVKVTSAEELMKEWGLSGADVAGAGDTVESEDFEVEPEVEPICFGNYDDSNKTCLDKCSKEGWGDACKKVYTDKLALRARAKRISK